MMKIVASALGALLLLPSNPVASFSISTSKPGTSSRSAQFSTTIPSADTGLDTSTSAKGLFKRDRYVATNRFSVRRNQQAKFEKRWATRKSKLAQLDGFRYFHLMRRVNLDGEYQGGNSDEEAFENYVSFTIWEKKSHFSAWRTGEAFKEAHGGTSIGAFLSTMVGSAMVLRGGPRPAFYDGLFMQSTVPDTIPETSDGWRNVNADGVHTLPAECFVAFEKYYILSDNAKEFEDFWSSQPPVLAKDAEALDKPQGFVARCVMRRDGQAKGHGIVEMQSSEPSYVVLSIFSDKASYKSWVASAPTPEIPSSFFAKRDPETLFFEGTLVISSPQGA